MTEAELNKVADALIEAQRHYEEDVVKYGHKEGGRCSMENNANWTPVESKEYAGKGVAGAGLGLGIAGTALGLLGGNGLNGILGQRNDLVSQREFDLSQKLAEKDVKIGILEADKYTDKKITEAYVNLDAKFEKMRDHIGMVRDEARREKESLERELRDKMDCNKAFQDGVNLQQATLNATQTAAIACIQQQVNSLLGITKMVVPNSSVCPGWGNVTVAPATAAASA